MAAFSWVARSISDTAPFTDTMPSACCAADREMPSTMRVTLSAASRMPAMVWPASPTCRTPARTRAPDSSMSCRISRAAWALRCASVRTSPATTAKPLPCAPARAASTPALSARMLVWKAMLSTTPTISPMRRALCAMSSMQRATSATASAPRRARSAALAAWALAWPASPAVRCTASSSCVRLASASCTEPAWRAARSDISAPPAAISPAPACSSSTPRRTAATAAVSPDRMRRMAE